MAWRPTGFVVEAELDNTQPGKVTGWVRLAGMQRKLVLDLQGDFEGDIRGTKIHVISDKEPGQQAPMHLGSLSMRQIGRVACIKLISSWKPGGKYLYIEWYSQANGRVVIEFEPRQVSRMGGGTSGPANGSGTEDQAPVIVCVMPSFEGSADQGLQERLRAAG